MNIWCIILTIKMLSSLTFLLMPCAPAKIKWGLILADGRMLTVNALVDYKRFIVTVEFVRRQSRRSVNPR